MQESIIPGFPPEWQALVAQAANAMRTLALDEDAKQRFCTDRQLEPHMRRVAARYTAGRSISDAVQRLRAIQARGHAASVEYMGESCRDEAKAHAETRLFLELIEVLDAENLDCSISLDLSHVGSLIDPELGYRNLRRIATAAASAGREVMISMEGSDRAENIYATYARLQTDDGLANVGITVPAKLHRTVHDLPRLMAYPGRIRLVKGAFAEPAQLAHGRHDPGLADCYRNYAMRLLATGHKCSIATHDRSIQDDLAAYVVAHAPPRECFEFESLIGLGTEQIDGLQRRGFPTREYAVFGDECFLYVLNRIAEQPVRLFQALVDLIGPAAPRGPDTGLGSPRGAV